MIRCNHKKRQLLRRGSALLYVLAVITAAAVLFTGFIQFVTSHVRYDRTLEPNMQALHVAEAGVYFYRWYLAHQLEGLTSIQQEIFWKSHPLGVDSNNDGVCDDSEAYVASYGDNGKYRICVTPPSHYSTILWISAQGIVSSGGTEHVHTVRARLRKESWSEYAVLANADMRLSDGTKINGRIHVNGGFQFDGTVSNVVSSSLEKYRYPDVGTPRYNSDNACWPASGVWWCKAVWTKWPNEKNSNFNSPVFVAGKNFPVPTKDFSSVKGNFAVIKTEAEHLGLAFGPQQKGRLIELGKPTANEMRISTVKTVETVDGRNEKGENEKKRDTFNILELSPSGAITMSIPQEGVIYVEDDTWVQGELPENTKLTIAVESPSNAAAHDARIILGGDNLIYSDRTGGSVLGLMAEGNIEIMQNSKNDLRIDAALLSQGGRVGRMFWADDYKNHITIYGAIATNARMGFGFVNASGSTTSGYRNRDIIFDAHLLDNPPPLFPTGNTYVIDLWESQ